MSEVKRYLAKISWAQIETQEHPNGEFVLHSDYARLKAEVERSTAQYNSIIDQQLNVIQGMQAEIDRLNEAIIRGAIIPDAKPE